MNDRQKAGSLPEDIYKILNEKSGKDLDKVVRSALSDKKILNEMVEGVVCKNETYRYNCYKVISKIAQSHPAVLYPYWDYFIGLFDSVNSYHRMVVVNIIADLTKADTESRFENIFNQYFDFLDDEKIVVARYLAKDAGKIAKYKPRLLKRITKKLLDVDGTHHTEDRKDLLKSDIIESFDQLFEDLDDKEEILVFTKAQLDCSSPRTRKMARALLDKFGK